MHESDCSGKKWWNSLAMQIGIDSGLIESTSRSQMSFDQEFFDEQVLKLLLGLKEQGFTSKDGLVICLSALETLLLLDLTEGLEGKARLAKMNSIRPKVMMSLFTPIGECRKEVPNE